MIDRRVLVLDANILIRAVVGVRARELVLAMLNTVVFCAPDIAFEDARRYLPPIAAAQGRDTRDTLEAFDLLAELVEIVVHSSYAVHETKARERISHRDAADWPIVATALLLQAPIWTEDQDFFGCGIATWTTATVEQYSRL